jgi:DNA-3-methyladenine glycosylase II
MSPPSFGAAARILAERDPVIARLVAEAGPPRLSRPTESHFSALVRAIVYQQLAGRAAAAIHGRLIAAVGGDALPEPLLALTDEQMRAVGLSRNKMASLRDLAAKVLDGTVVLAPRGLARESDDEIITRLSAVRGIGPWTAEMFLIFQLRRLDVWPVGDLGVRRGYGLAWQVPEPTARELMPLGEPFRPYRSVAAWYCWRAAELYAGAADSALTRLTGSAHPGRAMMGGCRSSPWRRPLASYSSVPGTGAGAAPRPPSSAATRRCSARPSSLWSAARAWPSTRAPGRRACTSCPAGSGCRRASTPGTAGTATC